MGYAGEGGNPFEKGLSPFPAPPSPFLKLLMFKGRGEEERHAFRQFLFEGELFSSRGKNTAFPQPLYEIHAQKKVAARLGQRPFFMSFARNRRRRERYISR